MHDPDVVAFQIRRPWPKRSLMHDSVHHKRTKDLPRWTFRLHHECTGCTDGERARHGPNPFPWWKPKSWTPFWTVAGRGYYWPGMITVWHREPGGRDSGEVCKHYTRTQDEHGKWSTTMLHGWKFHLHHWKIQIGPLQTLRRWALTRCAWCGGRSRGKDQANISHQWNREPGSWWRGETGLYHHDCSSIQAAHRACTCDDPVTEHSGWGRCGRCAGFRVFGRAATHIETDRLLATIPVGFRDAAVYEQAKQMWAAARLG